MQCYNNLGEVKGRGIGPEDRHSRAATRKTNPYQEESRERGRGTGRKRATEDRNAVGFERAEGKLLDAKRTEQKEVSDHEHYKQSKTKTPRHPYILVYYTLAALTKKCKEPPGWIACVGVIASVVYDKPHNYIAQVTK